MYKVPSPLPWLVNERECIARTKLWDIRSPGLVACPSPAASRWIHFHPGPCYPLSIYIPALYLCLHGGVSVQRYAEQVHFMRTSACPLGWRVFLCPNILHCADCEGLDAGNSAVRLSCIALPTLSCHVTVFAFHLSLYRFLSLSLSLSLSPRQQSLQLYTVITLSFCRSSTLVASRRASRRHRSCILHAR